MLSYKGEIEERQDPLKNYESFRVVYAGTFVLAELDPMIGISYRFIITTKYMCNDLKQFLEGHADKIEFWTSEQHNSITSDSNNQTYTFTMKYLSPIINLSFTLKHDVCRDAFRQFALDLENHPHRY